MDSKAADDNEPTATIEFDLRDNGRKKLLFVGKTGAGKSALCNALSLPVEESDEFQECKIFPESAKRDIGNKHTILSNVNFMGQPDKKVSFIDTVGFDSTEKKTSEVAEFIVKLKDNCDYINLIAVVLSNPKRLDDSSKETIELLESMFGKDQFWKSVLSIITNLSQSDKEIKKRSKRSVDDDDLINSLKAEIKEKFRLDSAIDFPFFIMDAHFDFDLDSEDEKARFKNRAEMLYTMLVDGERKHVAVNNIKHVVGKYEGLQEALRTAEIKSKKEHNENKRLRKERDELLKAKKKAEENAVKLANDIEKAEMELEDVKKSNTVTNEEIRQREQEISLMRQDEKKAKEDAAKLTWKYKLACLSLLVLACGGATVAGVAAAGAVASEATILEALIALKNAEAVKTFLVSIGAQLQPIVIAYIKKKLGFDSV